MIISVEKPGSPIELVHFGVKGQKWGVRKERTSAEQAKHDKQVKKVKKVAVGVGVATVAVGAAAATYYLHKNGKLPFSEAKKRGKIFKNVDDIPKPKVSEIVQAKRSADRERFIKLMMSSKKYPVTLEEATRIANETYSRL